MKKLIDIMSNEYIKKLDALNFEIKKRVSQNNYSGNRISNAKGNSMDFSDFKNYTFGDDLRRIDWSSFARLDKLFTKLYHEERQISVNIFLDKSISMEIYDEKAIYSKQLAASIAYIAMKNSERINLYTFSQDLNDMKKGISGKASFFEVMKFLDNIKYEGKTYINNLFNKGTTFERGISIIISDVFSLDGYENAIKFLKYNKQEVILVQILHKEESHPSISGPIKLIDSETGEAFEIEVGNTEIENYKKALKQYQSEISVFCKKHGVFYRFINTNDNIFNELIEIIKI